MSESAINGPVYESSSELSSDAQLVSFNPLHTENSHDNRSIEAAETSLKLRPLLDTRMSQTEIAEIVETWNPSRVFRNKQYAERPATAIHWMLEQTGITIDVSEEKAQRDALAERERRKSRGLTISKAQKNIADLTPKQIQKLELAKVNDLKIAAAQRKVDELAADGLSNLIDLIENLEGQVMEQCPNANIVRLFNGVDDKTGGKDRDLIIAKRTLVVMLADELPGEPSQ